MKTFFLLVAGSIFASSQLAFADHPCHAKREAKHAARKTLHECVEAWAHDRKPTDADPTDDCNGKLSAFVAAAKEVKACHVANPHK